MNRKKPACPAGGKSPGFQKTVIAWYRCHGRTFYWRTHRLGIWKWLVLELLLKRTRAETVEKVFPLLSAKYPRPKTVAEASDSELERDLKCLGLYRQRRLALKQVADKIISEYSGRTPTDQASLASLPHVGLYISNAVMCFCCNQRRPVVDSNIARVLTRSRGLDMPRDVRAEWLWALAEKMLPDRDWQEYNYGLLDIGATICRRELPECSQCCLKDICESSEERL
jgi:A/G-specific adenine glycosylase